MIAVTFLDLEICGNEFGVVLNMIVPGKALDFEGLVSD